RVGDELRLARVVGFFVHAQHDAESRTLGGCGDHDFLCTGGEVLRGVRPTGEEARRLEHDVHTEVLPGELRGIAQRQDLELVAVYGNRVAHRFDLRVQVAEHRVVLQQVRQRCRAREIV